MVAVYIPPPTTAQLAMEWAEYIAQQHEVKVTVTIEGLPPNVHTVSIDGRPEWKRLFRSAASNTAKET